MVELEEDFSEKYGHRERSVSKTQVVVALDIGSAASRAMAFSKTGEVLAQSQSEYQTYFPGPGWVEQDALEIWEATQKALREVLWALGAERVAAIGMANQRETTLLWNRRTGQPLYRAIAWQCRWTVKLSLSYSLNKVLVVVFGTARSYRMISMARAIKLMPMFSTRLTVLSGTLSTLPIHGQSRSRPRRRPSSTPSAPKLKIIIVTM
jgi:hypothetical protein